MIVIVSNDDGNNNEITKRMIIRINKDDNTNKERCS